MRVVHVSPTYFSPESVIGGGERFAEELAYAMSRRVDVKLVSFGKKAKRERVSGTFERVRLHSLTRSLMTPFSPLLFRELRGGDVIHCHQYYVLPTFMAAWWGHRTRRKVFVSDLGGGGWTPAYQIDQSRWITAHLPISRYATRWLHGSNGSYRVIYGGVDLDRYRMRPEVAHDGSVVFLGRILPHKGLHFLVQGLPEGTQLHIVGTPGDERYLAQLRALGSGKRVKFHLGLGDDAVVALLQRAMALVHPTPVDADGSAGWRELFGLAIVEAMACGCPVIASAAASLSEIVEDGVSGVLVPPNEPSAIAGAITSLSRNPTFWQRASAGARFRAESAFSWERVVERALAAYANTSSWQTSPTEVSGVTLS